MNSNKLLTKAVSLGLTGNISSVVHQQSIGNSLFGSSKLSAGRLTVANSFFDAFSNPTARIFVKSILIENYTHAIMTHHPDRQSLNGEYN